MSGAASITASTSTIAMTATGSPTFIGGGKPYNNLTLTGAASSTVTITGANTFNTLTIGAPKTVIFPSSTTTTVTNLILGPGAGIILKSSTAGTQWTISAATGQIAIDGVTLTDSKTTG